MPSLLVRYTRPELSNPAWLGPVLALWILPFLFLGLTLTMRRAIDAGRSPFLAAIFLVPYANYAVIALLSAWPSAPAVDPPEAPGQFNVPHVKDGYVAAAAGVLIGVSAVGIGVNTGTLPSYGAWLFVLTPFAIGSVTAFVVNRRQPATAHDTRAWVLVALLLTGI